MSSDPTTSPVPPHVEHTVDSADSTVRNPQRAVIALGSNLGNRLETLQGAVDALADTPGVQVGALSAVYETDPVGGPAGQASYYNAVIVVDTTLDPRSLLERAAAVEDAFNRTRAVRWGPRTLDVDIIAYQGVVSDDPRLILPHPRAHQRAFVLAPWHDADPDADLPGRGRVADLLKEVGAQGVRRRDDIELHLPE
jgi:2-amino-4-hydroxy-6-hydroxymethyldihydropteridine diphosphokinase